MKARSQGLEMTPDIVYFLAFVVSFVFNIYLVRREDELKDQRDDAMEGWKDTEQTLLEAVELIKLYKADERYRNKEFPIDITVFE
jgi:hypothetical protein